MAQLTSNDYKDIKNRIRRDPDTLSEFKTWGLEKSVWYSIFQAVEDWLVGGFNGVPVTSLKAAIETQSGPISAAQAKEVAFVWMGWRYAKKP